MHVPQGSSINATRKVVDDLEKILKADPDIEHWSFYIGSGAIRFYLPLDQQLANDFFAQGVVVTKGFKVRPACNSASSPRCNVPSSSRWCRGSARWNSARRLAGRLSSALAVPSPRKSAK